jgi:predicted HTH transcriptional regulator
MNKSTIQVIKEGEGLTTEFKRKIDSPFKIAKTLTAFANTSGGLLLIGVLDNGTIAGVQSELTEMQKLEKASSLTEPVILVQVKSQVIDGKKILVAEIGESADKPHYAINEKGEHIIYIRVKDKSTPTPKLLVFHEGDADTEKLLANRHVKTLISFLKETDLITAKLYAKMINISEKRAERLLYDLTTRQILLRHATKRAEFFSLKWSK